LALSQTPVFTLGDHGYGASVSRGVPVCVPAMMPVPNLKARAPLLCGSNVDLIQLLCASENIVGGVQGQSPWPESQEATPHETKTLLTLGV